MGIQEAVENYCNELKRNVQSARTLGLDLQKDYPLTSTGEDFEWGLSWQELFQEQARILVFTCMQLHTLFQSDLELYIDSIKDALELVKGSRYEQAQRERIGDLIEIGRRRGYNLSARYSDYSRS